MLLYIALCVHVRPLNPCPTHNPPTPLILYRCTHLRTHNPTTPLILFSCTHNPPTPIVFASPVLPSGESYGASVSMNRLIKHLKEVGSLPEETGNYGQMKKSKKGLNALWSTVSSFLARTLTTSSVKSCSKALSSFPPKSSKPRGT